MLATTATALNDAGHWAEIVDREGRYVFITDDARLSWGGLLEPAAVPLGAHYYGPEAVDMRLAWRGDLYPVEVQREIFSKIGGVLLTANPGGRDQLREVVDPRMRDLVDGLSATALHAPRTFRLRGLYKARGRRVDILVTVVPLQWPAGRACRRGVDLEAAAGMAVLGAIAAEGDADHFERMVSVAKPARRPTAILFADLEASSQVARRLSTASYFALGRRLFRAADDCIVEAGGIVGRHAGDGVVAFFLADQTGSESDAARACIVAARGLRDAAASVAVRSDLRAEDVVLRFGLHWGASLYVGLITTSGRTEVTALGDQVNETARIEACATGGRALASKDLMERLGPDDAAALDLDPNHVTYTPLGDLATATEKARRDAPGVAVCEV